MYNTAQMIITVASVVSAIGVLIGVILKIHSFALEQKQLRTDLSEQEEEHKREIAELKKEYDERISKLEKHHNDDMRRVNTENCLICFALSACLDGLQQLGANHNVSDAKEKLDKYLNQQAHE